ncbi:glycoside hydrolase family 97 protein [Shewanella psychrotolerans]|uniref:glycoside hydrolase family 97 protein n=1 Tax=Shewanella psychrotolerans TaxID=2864206 RepID=UPI001C65E47E|nr:glycoside hydrolase family 97 protein [Shewanella psychrotolerans]QYK03051.1 glycoside hydrolase family 97 protein [Shewanella psychrotolerans]
MKSILPMTLSLLCLAANTAYGNDYQVHSPDQQIAVTISLNDNQLSYQIDKNNAIVLAPSSLGLSLADRHFYQNFTQLTASDISIISEDYQLFTGKQSQVHYQANQRQFYLLNDKDQKLAITFRVSDDGVAFRYSALADESASDSDSVKTITKEHTSFQLPSHSKAWLQPIAEAQTGWANTNPSYEEHYLMEIDVDQPSPSPAGWVFPALFNTSKAQIDEKQQVWLAITEAGVKSYHHASRLEAQSPNGNYHIGQPQAAEVFTHQGLLTTGKLPLDTPWRVLALGSLAQVANSTLGTDLAEPAQTFATNFIKPGVASWSWGLLKDDSITFPVQKQFIDHAADMHWQYALVDVNWDKNIGDKKLAQLVEYANSKHVGVFVWYNSSGDWNTTEYSPKSQLLTKTTRQKAFAKLQAVGVKGVKIDFFSGDGQSMMQYYHDILDDAAKYQLLVNFHGTTLPRGLQRTYPNLLTSEAVRGFEMITFFQNAADKQASHCAMLPFARNLFDPMDFTPTTFNEIPSIKRKTTNGFELALPIIFISGIQHIVETPGGIKTVPTYVKQFLRQLPVQWDESRYIAGTPGKLAVFARRSGNLWYIAGINGENSAKTVNLDLSFLAGKTAYAIKSDGDRGFSDQNIVITTTTKVTLAGNDGFVMRIEN